MPYHLKLQYFENFTISVGTCTCHQYERHNSPSTISLTYTYFTYYPGSMLSTRYPTTLGLSKILTRNALHVLVPYNTECSIFKFWCEIYYLTNKRSSLYKWQPLWWSQDICCCFPQQSTVDVPNTHLCAESNKELYI